MQSVASDAERRAAQWSTAHARDTCTTDALCTHILAQGTFTSSITARVGPPCAVRSPPALLLAVLAHLGFLVAAPGRAVCVALLARVSCHLDGHDGNVSSVWAARTYELTWSTIPFELLLQGLRAVSQRQCVFEMSEWRLVCGHPCWSWQRDLDHERPSVSDPAPENFPWLRSNYYVMDSTPYVLGQEKSCPIVLLTCPERSRHKEGNWRSRRFGFGPGPVELQLTFHDNEPNYDILCGPKPTRTIAI